MERRALIAIGLSLAVLLVWQVVFPPPKPPTLPPVPESIVEETAPAVVEADPLDASTSGGAPSESVEASALETERVETDDALVVFTNKGGRVLSWKLKRYKDTSGDNLELVPGADLPARQRRWGAADLDEADAALSDWLPFAIDLPGDQAFESAANTALYQMERRGTRAAPEVVLTWADGRGHEVVKSIRLGPGFTASVRLEVRRDGQPVPAGLAWGAGFGETLTNGAANRFGYRGQALVDERPKPTRLSAGSLDAGEQQSLAGERLWGGSEDTYFAALFLPEPSAAFRIRHAELPALAAAEPQPGLTVSVLTPGDGTPTNLYVGPKNYQLLKSMGRHLEEVVYFQSRVPLVGPITRGLFYALVFIHEKIVANWGWAIVILTLGINGILWPIRHRTMLSMKHTQEKMKRLQPRVASIKERYRKASKKDIDSRQKMNQEVMAIYKKEGINPASNLTGCLPLFLQMPILFAFYNLLQVAIELRQAPFIFWVHDLASMDPYYVLPVVMGGSMLVQQVLTGSAIPDAAQRRMMYFMPIMFTFFFLQMPSGLVVYWLVNNLLGIVQQQLVNQRHAHDIAPDAAPAGKRTAAGRKA